MIAAHSEETTKPEPPCITEDTEEGRMNRTKAWVTEAATQDITWESDRELFYQDQDVRLKEPEQADSHVTPASQRRSEPSMDLPSGRRASIASRRIDRSPDHQAREKIERSVRSGWIEPSLPSEEHTERGSPFKEKTKHNVRSGWTEPSLVEEERTKRGSPFKEKSERSVTKDWPEPGLRVRREVERSARSGLSSFGQKGVPPST